MRWSAVLAFWSADGGVRSSRRPPAGGFWLRITLLLGLTFLCAAAAVGPAGFVGPLPWLLLAAAMEALFVTRSSGVCGGGAASGLAL